MHRAVDGAVVVVGWEEGVQLESEVRTLAQRTKQRGGHGYCGLRSEQSHQRSQMR